MLSVNDWPVHRVLNYDWFNNYSGSNQGQDIVRKKKTKNEKRFLCFCHGYTSHKLRLLKEHSQHYSGENNF